MKYYLSQFTHIINHNSPPQNQIPFGLRKDLKLLLNDTMELWNSLLSPSIVDHEVEGDSKVGN
jgi:hypothetical protein